MGNRRSRHPMPKKSNEATPPPDGSTTIIVPPPEGSADAAQAEALAEISDRMEAVETRITEGLEGERQWTTQTITSLQTELATLKEQVQSLTTENQSLTASQQTLRDELIQQLREAKAKLEAAQPPEPPKIPTEEPP